MSKSDWGDFIDAAIANKRPAPAPTANGKHPEPDDPYVKAAVTDELNKLVAMPPRSGRNTAVYEAAKSLGQFPLNRAQLRDQLLATCQTNGLLAEDGFRACDNSITSGFNAADRKGPRVISADRPKMGGGVTEVVAASINGNPLEGGRRVVMTNATQITDDTPVWAWTYNNKGRIQLGTLALFAGRPGAGKSTAARWFAAQATIGRLEGHWHGQPQNVAYIAPAEESVRYVIKPGLRAAGADLDRITFPQVYDSGKEVRLLSVLDEEQLADQFLHHHITVVIVDPVMSTISGNVDIHRNNEVRAYIEPWARIADHIDGIVVGVAHLRKSSGGDLVAAITGSSAFGEVARAVFGFAKDPDSEDNERVMSQAKNSTGFEDLSVTYKIETETVLTDSGAVADVGAFAITGISTVTAEDILNTIGMREGGAGVEVRRWLYDYLEREGTAPSKDVKSDAKKEGFSEPTVKRAAAKLRVVFESRGYPRITYWALPQLDHPRPKEND